MGRLAEARGARPQRAKALPQSNQVDEAGLQGSSRRAVGRRGPCEHRNARSGRPPMIARRLPTCPSKSQLIGIANADIVSRLHPRLFQPALNFALMVQIKGFTLKLPVPTGDG